MMTNFLNNLPGKSCQSIPRKIGTKNAQLIGILFIACLWAGCRGDVKDTSQTPSEVTTDTAATQTNNTASTEANAEPVNLGKPTTKKLACGTELKFPEKGMEAALLAFIEDKNRQVSEDTWFEFDRLAYQADKGSLDVRKSFEQLNNLLQILKCYPLLTLTMDGPDTDQKQNWATIMKATLIGLGVEPHRLQLSEHGAHPASLGVKVTGK